jgi:flagellar export protein FliJ
MPFQFPLEAILRLRRGQERLERLKLEAIASEQGQAKRRLETITEQSYESRRLFQKRMGQETSGSELQFEYERATRTAAVRRALELRISELEQARRKQLAEYMKARQKREILESLRDRRFEVYRQGVSRREQQSLDDLFLMRLDLFRDE